MLPLRSQGFGIGGWLFLTPQVSPAVFLQLIKIVRAICGKQLSCFLSSHCIVYYTRKLNKNQPVLTNYLAIYFCDFVLKHNLPTRKAGINVKRRKVTAIKNSKALRNVALIEMRKSQPTTGGQCHDNYTTVI